MAAEVVRTLALVVLVVQEQKAPVAVVAAQELQQGAQAVLVAQES